MKQALMLFAVVAVALLAGYRLAGYGPTYSFAYGSLAALSLVIAFTFGWLWWVRATPLALGMVFSWLGAAGVIGWWWTFAVYGRPPAMSQHPGLFLGAAAYLVGAVLHLVVMQRTMGARALPYWGLIAVMLAGVALVP